MTKAARNRNVRFPDATWDALVHLARRLTVEQDGEPVTVSAIVRQAVDRELRRYGRHYRKGDHSEP